MNIHFPKIMVFHENKCLFYHNLRENLDLNKYATSIPRIFVILQILCVLNEVTQLGDQKLLITLTS